MARAAPPAAREEKESELGEDENTAENTGEERVESVGITAYHYVPVKFHNISDFHTQ